MSETPKVYVLTYESGEYSSWNLQVIGVYTNEGDANADCDALLAKYREGYEVNEFPLLGTRNFVTCQYCAHAFTDGTESIDSTLPYGRWKYLCPKCGGVLRDDATASPQHETERTR